MKKNQFLFLFLIVLTSAALVFNGCKKDDDPVDLSLSSLTTGDIDLNGATSPSNVPVEPVIKASFNVNIDPATVNASSVSLTQDYDGANIPLTTEVSNNIITIRPNQALGSGTLYKLKLTAAIKSTDAKPLSNTDRAFTTAGTFSPAGVIAHWTFEDNANDVVGSYNPSANGIVDITYTAGRKTAAGKAAKFNGTTSIIEIPNGDQLMDTKDFTLSFWAKAEPVEHGHFIIGLAAFYGFQFELYSGFNGIKMPVQFDLGDGTSGTGGDFIYNGDGQTLDNGGWRGTIFNKENASLPAILENKWFHFVYVYNSETKIRSMFLNGEKVIAQDHNLWYDDDGNPYPERGITGLKYAGEEPETLPELAFGFVHSRGGTLWDDQP
ncbi:MAG: Ig-like domain-containing protein, partial [Bacteroidales bacterium]|nr:Ig-like domain-containing protein [Bacteroidales bacterium]